MLPLLPASIALQMLWFSDTRPGFGMPGWFRIAERATAWTVYVVFVLDTMPLKTLACGRVISTPTRSQSLPSAVALTVCGTPLPSDVAFINGLPSGTGFVTVTVVVPTVRVATRGDPPE